MELPTAEIRSTAWTRDVYEPSDDTFLLVDALQQQAMEWSGREEKPRTVIELGSGSGFVICSMALMLKALGIVTQLIAIDHNVLAASATRDTLDNHKVGDCVEVVATSLFQGLGHLMGQVDILIFNPPYVPTPDDEVASGGIASAWAGGHRGRRVIDKVLTQLPALLSQRGEIFMVTVSENDPAGIIKEMEPQGFTGRIIMARQADEETLSIVHLRRMQ